MTGQLLDDNLRNFLKHIEAIKDTLPMTILSTRPHFQKIHRDMSEFIKNKVEVIENENKETKILISVKDSKLFKTIDKNLSLSLLAPKIITESLFVALISQYDAFLTNLLRIIFQIKPDILNSSEKNLTFSQLVEFENIEKARDYITEKEIESVLRKSHTDHFIYLERILGIPLRVNLPIWSSFIEITERRNLFVHCNGEVSNQYISICRQNDYTVDKIKVGNRLKVDAKYVEQAHDCLYEMSVKLTHTVWRKLLSLDLENADKKLNEICFDLIDSKSFGLSDNLLLFGINQQKHFNEVTKNLFIINKALSHYLQDKKDECKSILSKKDWSAASDDFKLAYNVLIEDYDEAYIIMRRIGKNGIVNRVAYIEWPLFTKISEKEEFKNVYREIFEEDFIVTEPPMGIIQEILKKDANKDIKSIPKERNKAIRKEKINRNINE